MLCPTDDLVCESWRLWLLQLGKGGMVDCRPFGKGGMVDGRPFGTLIKVLDSLLRRTPTHSQTQIFVYVSGDVQSLVINMDFPVLKTSHKIWSYLAFQCISPSIPNIINITVPSALPPFLLLGVNTGF